MSGEEAMVLSHIQAAGNLGPLSYSAACVFRV